MIDNFIPLPLGRETHGFVPFANSENIPRRVRKLMTKGILDVNSLKASLMLLPALNDSNTISIPSTSHHDNIPNIKLNEICDLVDL